MGQVKQMAMDNAEKNVDIIIENYKDNKINMETAKSNILKVENVIMTGIDSENVDEVLNDAMTIRNAANNCFVKYN